MRGEFRRPSGICRHPAGQSYGHLERLGWRLASGRGLAGSVQVHSLTKTVNSPVELHQRPMQSSLEHPAVEEIRLDRQGARDLVQSFGQSADDLVWCPFETMEFFARELAVVDPGRSSIARSASGFIAGISLVRTGSGLRSGTLGVVWTSAILCWNSSARGGNPLDLFAVLTFGLVSTSARWLCSCTSLAARSARCISRAHFRPVFAEPWPHLPPAGLPLISIRQQRALFCEEILVVRFFELRVEEIDRDQRAADNNEDTSADNPGDEFVAHDQLFQQINRGNRPGADNFAASIVINVGSQSGHAGNDPQEHCEEPSA